MESFLVKNRNELIREESRSGGAFSAISDWILSNGGRVYGCILDSDYEVRHIGTDSVDGRNAMRGSKYVQSEIGNTFIQAMDDLKNDKYVLFSGTACQIDGLLSCCKNLDTSKLYTVDIVCHGVSSPRIWKDYVQHICRINKGHIQRYFFRDKRNFGWRESMETYEVNGHRYHTRQFMDLFYSGNIMRDACFSCQYKNLNRKADITLGDAWGIEKSLAQMDDNKGVSLVLVNDEKGKFLFENIKKDIDFYKCDINEFMQEALQQPYAEPTGRGFFWHKYKQFGLKYFLDDKKNYSLGRRITRKIYTVLRNNIADKRSKFDLYSFLVQNKSKCCGCAACYTVCPVNLKESSKAITMKEDKMGFYYPVIDEKVCMKCNKCINVCPQNNS